MKLKTVIICAVVAAMLGGIGSIALAPATAEDVPYTAPVVNCEEGTLPGWLNEHGDPTSCVDNHPCIATDTQDWNCNPITPAEPIVVAPAPTVVVPIPVPAVKNPAAPVKESGGC